MKSTALTFLLCTFAIVLTGCPSGSSTTTPSSGGGSIGVVDLDKLGKAMGWNDEMKTNLDATKAQVAAQLNEFLDYKKKDFEAKRDEISKVLPAAQKDKFTNAKSLTRADLTAMGLTTTQIDEFLQAYAIVAQATQEANEKGNQIVQAQYQAIVKAYQEAAAPSIRRVAVASNRQVVLQPMGALYTDPQIDLTDGVVDDLRKTNSSKVELPPIPKLNIPMPEKK